MTPSTVIMIASSTGGPQVIRKVFKDMPALNSAIVIVQHMQASACEHFALNLNKQTDMNVKVAEHGESLERGGIYIAPGDCHLQLNGVMINLVAGEKVNYVCPSADVAMQSVTSSVAPKLAGIVFSGLGEDGAKGIEYMKKVGAVTIVQKPETCVVSCMSFAAIDTGCVDYILTPCQIREGIMKMSGRLVGAR